MDYTQEIYIEAAGNDITGEGTKLLPYLTLAKALASITTTNPIIYLGNGEFLINQVIDLSLPGIVVTIKGNGIHTTILVDCCPTYINFNGDLNIYNCMITPSLNFWGDTRFITYSGDTFFVNYYNVLFKNRGVFPTTAWISTNNDNDLFNYNKNCYNCTFISNIPPSASSLNLVHNCATESADETILNGNTSEDTKFSARIKAGSYVVLDEEIDLYGVYSGDNKWILLMYYLIKKDSNYYSVKPEFYNEISHIFTPLTLGGGDKPNKADIETFGFDNLNLLIAPIIKGNDNFKPIDKFGDNLEIELYISH